MQTQIADWLEEKTGASRRQMALKIGQAPSTFNRNIDTAETIIAVCRAYEINPIDGLIEAGLLKVEEVTAAASKASLAKVSERELLEEVLHRVAQRDDSELTKPVNLADHRDPDYSGMTEEEAYDLGLVAKKQDDHIAGDEIDNTP
jgi:hypothetical protein